MTRLGTTYLLAVKIILLSVTVSLSSILLVQCIHKQSTEIVRRQMTAKEILGDPQYRAISYGGYRLTTRDQQPTVEELKEDMLLLHAIGIRVIRTYNVQLAHASNVLKAISELKQSNLEFSMFVMLGAWIDCKNAWSDRTPIHNQESERNAFEIERAVLLANQYPDIVKVIAVGNEAMVKWAAAYYVEPEFVLKWVNHLQTLKLENKLPQDLWITSSDNFASWGGGEDQYKVPKLEALIKAVDYISLHTYPMHDTHYNPDFWTERTDEAALSDSVKVEKAMTRSLQYAQKQYRSVVAYMHSLGVDKPVHIGETGWASSSDGLYGSDGSRACDEYKQKLYHDKIRAWTDSEKISCFFFEAFDERWKDAQNPNGSENHFGLFDFAGKAKYVLWQEVDNSTFENIGRSRNTVEKTFSGNFQALKQTILFPRQTIVEQH